jgi:hypothetical protein
MVFIPPWRILELLHYFADKVLVPSLVIREIRAKGPHDISVIAM